MRLDHERPLQIEESMNFGSIFLIFLDFFLDFFFKIGIDLKLKILHIFLDELGVVRLDLVQLVFDEIVLLFGQVFGEKLEKLFVVGDSRDECELLIINDSLEFL